MVMKLINDDEINQNPIKQNEQHSNRFYELLDNLKKFI